MSIEVLVNTSISLYVLVTIKVLTEHILCTENDYYFELSFLCFLSLSLSHSVRSSSPLKPAFFVFGFLLLPHVILFTWYQSARVENLYS